MSLLSKTLRVASLALCLLVALSFLLFAVNQTSTASGHQQAELAGGSAVAQSQGGHHAQERGLHRSIDEAAEAVTSPVSGLSSSAWAEHGLRLIFALLVFGFALGYLARVIKVRT
jgi:hypothetical protein